MENTDGYITLDELLSRTGLNSRNTLWRRMRQAGIKKFLDPTDYRRTVVHESAVESILAPRPRARKNTPAT